MSPGEPEERLDLSDLVGAAEEALEGRLGPAGARREVGDECWLVFRRPGVDLRVRCAPTGAGGGRTVRSWSATYAEPRATLREAAEPLGLWPACGPDRRAEDLDAPMARRGLGGDGGGPERSFTAVAGAGGFRRVAVFDEPPEWT